jgi:VIT1/CCC1 family predicted Fe2+/Mn2+ transporter
MISGQMLTALLHALSTGFPDRAVNIAVTAEDIDDDLRRAMCAAIAENKAPMLQVQAIGDILRDAKADQALINECYRAAFYLGPDWLEMTKNPLYAHFVANRAGPVLDKWVHYFPIYARHLERFRGRQIKVLEIGVYRGGGLDMWSHYLGPGARLVGLDIDEAAVRAVGDRIPVVLGDQEDPEVLRRIDHEYGPFDVIIDDGGHAMRQQISSIETLFPLLNDGGTYIVEDTHTSYWSEFGGRLGSPDTFLEWSKGRVDDMHSRHSSDIDRTSVWATHLDGMHVYDSVVVFDKKARFRSFNEIVGSSSYLFAGRFSEVLGIEILATRDAALTERDRARERLEQLGAEEGSAERVTALKDAEATSEELRLARAELQLSKQKAAQLDAEVESQSEELARTRGQLLDSWEQVKNMRSTVSWRLTAPLRAVRRSRTR